jgi:hypothetical protein
MPIDDEHQRLSGNAPRPTRVHYPEVLKRRHLYATHRRLSVVFQQRALRSLAHLYSPLDVGVNIVECLDLEQAVTTATLNPLGRP